MIVLLLVMPSSISANEILLCEAKNEKIINTAVNFIIEGENYPQMLVEAKKTGEKQTIEFCQNFINKDRIFIMHYTEESGKNEPLNFWIYENGIKKEVDQKTYENILGKIEPSDPAVKSAAFSIIKRNEECYLMIIVFTAEYSSTKLYKVRLSKGDVTFSYNTTIIEGDPRTSESY